MRSRCRSTSAIVASSEKEEKDLPPLFRGPDRLHRDPGRCLGHGSHVAVDPLGVGEHIAGAADVPENVEGGGDRLRRRKVVHEGGQEERLGRELVDPVSIGLVDGLVRPLGLEVRRRDDRQGEEEDRKGPRTCRSHDPAPWLHGPGPNGEPALGVWVSGSGWGAPEGVSMKALDAGAPDGGSEAPGTPPHHPPTRVRIWGGRPTSSSVTSVISKPEMRSTCSCPATRWTRRVATIRPFISW
jgi:hypothetical protein